MKSDMGASGKKKRIRIVDTTLRDGEQAPCVSFTLEDKVRIAGMLAEAGVDELEAGVPAMGQRIQEDIRELVRTGLSCRLTSWCRAKAKDIASARRCGTSGLHISFPVSEILLNSMERDESWVLKELERLLPMARWDFDRITVGAQDATRAAPAFLAIFLNLAAEMGAASVRIADTVGVSTPLSIYRLIRRLRRIRPGVPLEFHGHNDLGMATANTISAVIAGVSGVSVTINGLGERCGNAPLEEVVQGMNFVEGISTGMDTRHLMSICCYVAEASGRPIPSNKPVTGHDIFTHESGVHCAALIKDPLSYQPYLPETTGHGAGRFILGPHSGSRSIQYLLARAGINVSAEDAARFKEVLAGNYMDSD